MKKKKWNKILAVLLAMVTAVSLLSGCGGKSAEKEDAETITVYLWSTKLYEKYAPYIQEQLPDINVEFVVGNNDLDFYRFLNENGGLPDIITCCRFSLHDASPLKDSLMDLSTTNAAGAVYDTYLNSFRNQDGSVNWLPVCADAHGFVVNKDLFEKVFVNYKPMRIRTHWKPVYTAILIHKIVEVCIINSTCCIGCGKIHQAVFQRTGIMQGKPAAGYDIRQPSVFIQKPVEIQIIIAYYKFHIDIRKLFLDVWCIFVIQACTP